MRFVNILLDRIDDFTLKTQRYKFLILWLDLSICIFLFTYLKGIALPILLVLLIGLGFYYLKIILRHTQSELIKINDANNSTICEHFGILNDLIEKSNQNFEMHLNDQNSDMDKKHSILNKAILDLNKHLATNKASLIAVLVKECIELKKYERELVEQKTDFINGNIENVCKSILMQSEIHTKSITEEVKNSINDSQNILTDFIKDTAIGQSDVEKQNFTVVNEAIQNMQEKIFSEQNTAANGIKKDIADALAIINSCLDIKYEGLNNQAVLLNEIIVGNHEKIDLKITNAEENCIQRVNVLRNSMENVIDISTNNIINKIADENSQNRKQSVDKFTALDNQIAVLDDSMKKIVVENMNQIGNDIRDNYLALEKDIENKHYIINDHIKSSINDSKEYLGARLEQGFEANVVDITKTIEENTSLVLNASNETNKSVLKITEIVEIQKNSISQQMDSAIRDLIMYITTGLDDSSVKIMETNDDNIRSLEKQIECIATTVNEFAGQISSKFDSTKNSLTNISGELEKIGQGNHTLQDVDAFILTKQEQLVGDVQALASQLNNIRVLINSVKDNPNIIRERKYNREVIEDQENNLRINNTYEEDILRKSEMFLDDKIKYYVEYDNEKRMSFSRNYDANGNILTEIHYYPNEQVKERTEWIKDNGKINKKTTYYDEIGNKK